MAKYDPLYGFLKPFIGDLTISLADLQKQEVTFRKACKPDLIGTAE